MTLLDRALSYPEVGATTAQLPDGYDHLVVHRVIDHGESTFHRAADRLMSWQLHRAAGLTVTATTSRVEPDSRVRLSLGWHLLRKSFACQVIYVVEEERRRGFAYGTLQGHPGQGEERFCVEWREDDVVLFTLTAFSRAGTWWSRAPGADQPSTAAALHPPVPAGSVALLRALSRDPLLHPVSMGQPETAQPHPPDLGCARPTGQPDQRHLTVRQSLPQQKPHDLMSTERGQPH